VVVSARAEYSGADRRVSTGTYREDVHTIACGLIRKYDHDALDVLEMKLESCAPGSHPHRFWTDVLSLVTRRLNTLTGA
jgi:hypothetical protein